MLLTSKDDNIKVKWDDNPKKSACKTVLTLNNKDGKKIFVLYFYHAGSVLGQAEYWKHYFEMATFFAAFSDLSVRRACACLAGLLAGF